MSPLASFCMSMTETVCDRQAASWALWSSKMWPALRSCCHGCSSTSHPAGPPEFGHWNHCQLPIAKRLTDRLKLHSQKVRGSTPGQCYSLINFFCCEDKEMAHQSMFNAHGEHGIHLLPCMQSTVHKQGIPACKTQYTARGYLPSMSEQGGPLFR